MSKLPVVSAQECIRALQAAGFEIRRQKGSHIIMKRRAPPPVRTIPVPNHKTIKPGTLKSIIRQAGLTVNEFNELLKK